MNKDSRINYERNLRLIFMEYVAFKIAENSIWDFKELDSFFNKGKTKKRPSVENIMKIMAEHLNLCIDFYGERGGIRLFRKYLIWYTKGFYNVRPLREKISYIKTKKEMIKTIKACRDSQKLASALIKVKS